MSFLSILNWNQISGGFQQSITVNETQQKIKHVYHQQKQKIKIKTSLSINKNKNETCLSIVVE